MSSVNPSTNEEFEFDIELQEPPEYKVLLLNDDYTPMDFVVYILKNIFQHDDVTAEKIMLDIHQLGSGVAGIYPFEIADSKCHTTNLISKKNQHPLKCIIEEDSKL